MQKHCELHGLDYETVVKTLGGVEMDVGRCPECNRAFHQQLVKQGQLDSTREVIDNQLAQKRQERDKRFDRVGIPPRFRMRSFDSYQAVTDAQKKALRKVKRHAKAICEGAYGGLILSGNVGNGKTHLACAAAVEFEKTGRSALFLTVNEMVRKIRESYGGNSEVKLQQAINYFRDIDLLILDEVGVQSGSDDELNLLTDVINARYGWLKPTILISNLNVPEIEQLLGIRVVDRMREDGGLLVEFTWESYRRNRAIGAGSGG